MTNNTDYLMCPECELLTYTDGDEVECPDCGTRWEP